MKRDFPAFFVVRHEHLGIHDELLNWARLVAVHAHSSDCAPMFKHYRTSAYSVNAEKEWVVEEPRIPIDRLSGWKMERAISNLPEKHRTAVRWFYVFPKRPPQAVARRLGLSLDALHEHVHNGRSMLRNRGM